jgi:uncharacterized repeat protein (TIGR01451 family)
MEPRLLLATLFATNPSDSGPGTLRQAIHAASLSTSGDLSVELRTSATTIPVGTAVVYGLIATNNGSVPVTGVVVRDLIPPGSEIISIGIPQGDYTINAGIVDFRLGTLAPGQSVTIILGVTPTQAGIAFNQTAIVGMQSDPNLLNNYVTSTTTVMNLPGTLSFSQQVFQTTENSGFALITVTRTFGTQGTVSIPYITQDGTAIVGVDYLFTTGTLVFGPGETTKTFDLPILDRHLRGGQRTLLLDVGVPSGGAKLGAPFMAGLIIQDDEPIPDGPIVTGAFLATNASRVTGIVLTFNTPLDPFRAWSLFNYQVIQPGADGRFGTADDRAVSLRSVQYNPLSTVLILNFKHPQPFRTPLLLIVNGVAPFGLTDLVGNLLDGDGDGIAGGDFVTILGPSTGKKPSLGA